MTRREQLYPEIKRLREVEGLTWREIGERVGLSLKTAHDYYTHPTLAADRERRAKYMGNCEECGGPTNNGGAAGGPPRVCATCLNPPWTVESVIEAFLGWQDEHGPVPPREHDARIGGQGHGRLPYSQTVAKLFGSWNEGLLAAGYVVLHCDRRPETQEAIEAAIRAGESTASVAARFGVTPQAIHMRFRYRGQYLEDFRRAAA